jgi:dolichol-phosphate mannosyltransferase
MKCLIVIPTYNEIDSLPAIVGRLRSEAAETQILVVDDNSPDGTGAAADTMAVSDPAIHVLHRQTKEGLGRAYVAGFAWALARQFDRIVQMDADLSHDPRYLPAMLEASRSCDLVLGSRYVRGGGTSNWGWIRRMISRGGNWYARAVLRAGVHDLTGGFKCWRRETLADVDFESVHSNGYAFQIEMTCQAIWRGYRVTEVPIIFAERADGSSKMSFAIALEAVWMVWGLLLRRRGIRRSRRPGRVTDSA